MFQIIFHPVDTGIDVVAKANLGSTIEKNEARVYCFVQYYELLRED